jgi:hypothetical protein
MKKYKSEGLSSPSEIPGYSVKAKLLKHNGWVDFYHPDNWVKSEWRSDSSINIDWAGVNTEDAFAQMVKESGKTLAQLLYELNGF